MRIVGWSLIVVGMLVFARTIWLEVTCFGEMSEASRQRTYILFAIAPFFVLLGVWILYRARNRA